jgi:myo-inositol-1(or 4)-monophosphatase
MVLATANFFAENEMDSVDLSRRFHAAQAIVREAGQQALFWYRQRGQLTVERKGPQDVVSRADRECEAAIVESLRQLFPEDGCLGEEHGHHNAGAAALWVIDPIDGTANFVRGIPFWCVSLALIAGGKPVIGIIYNPVAEELYAAKRQAGARLNGRSIRVSATPRIDEARIGVGFSYRTTVDPHLDALRGLLEAHCEYSRLGSGALGMALTADGRLDGYWEAHINVWDVAAGLCLVEEAGGWTSEFMSVQAMKSGNPILASTPVLSQALRSVLPRGYY